MSRIRVRRGLAGLLTAGLFLLLLLLLSSSQPTEPTVQSAEPAPTTQTFTTPARYRNACSTRLLSQPGAAISMNA